MGGVVTRGVVHAELAGTSHMLVAAAAEVIRVGPTGANRHEVAEKRFTLQALKGLLILHSISLVNYIRKERIRMTFTVLLRMLDSLLSWLLCIATEYFLK